MCGIVGIAAFGGAPPPSREQLEAMCRSIAHRGPDDDGIDLRGGVGLGMRRLSIIDVEGGHQPIFNEDGSILTVLNGEIYNFGELRRQLEARGHRFRTRSDTEVIVHAYEEYGPQCVEHLNGMFAFALHDVRRGRLLLARDHIGIKPLYYAFVPPYLVWGSELKSVLASGLVERDLDIDALGQFFAWEYVPGSSTLLRAVRKLEPGHLIEIDLAAPRCVPVQYWDVPNHGEVANFTLDAWTEAVDAKLHECVQRQLVSDVPLGAFLSGGVDSSLMVSQMGQATTFSIGFDDPSYNELKWARRVAGHLGLDHHDEIIEPSVVDLFYHLVQFLDDPIGDFSIFPTYLVSRLARQSVKVVLSGDGGDELFGGYETYVADRWDRYYQRLPSGLRQGLVEPIMASLKPRPAKKGLVNKGKRFVEGTAHLPALSHARWRLFQDNSARQDLFTPEARTHIHTPVEEHIVKLFRNAGDRDPLNRSLYVDLKSYLSDNILVKVDRMSMATSLEARVPYLDPELVDLAFQVPQSFKLRGGQTKALLKRVAARHVPPDCVYRPKEGFSIPIKNWLGGQFRPILEELLAPRRLSDEGLFRPAVVERLKTEHFSGVANHSHVLWSLIVFQAWRDMWLNGTLREVRVA